MLLKMRPALLMACAAGLAGCVSIEQIAPSVSPALVSASRGSDAATLGEGRRIFTGACTTCHAPYPVAKYTASEWRGIVADMSARTKLTPARESALLAYLAAARTTQPAP